MSHQPPTCGPPAAFGDNQTLTALSQKATRDFQLSIDYTTVYHIGLSPH